MNRLHLITTVSLLLTVSCAPTVSQAPATAPITKESAAPVNTLQAASPANWKPGLTGFGYNSTSGVSAVAASAPEAAAALSNYPGATKPSSLIRIDFDNTKSDPDQDLKKAYALLDFSKPLNFSGVKTVTFEVFNPTSITLDAALTVSTTAGKEWQESKLISFQPGWSRINFNLTEQTFKAERSGWANTVAVQNLNDVRGLALMIYPHQGIKNYVLVSAPSTDTAVAE
ncbi:hypothetical protein [Deinococcus cellulosilyticus]|uniref:Uncharacterized protein n=1 Tax=Deinococcus cellulosilyticus (strain DSM 18568 / NBRC 106333 / KACC 11606 / 5516J-15) TaxID=1223518 RepID=A0A511MV25_DEIC1|nr:hypothetical protein [Deinococcus cellulosilyticus]GEM44439.1 hypothetical protein DC3_00740 [Deinococcus cellulosilyticus NBRC 106333 = KACC 11606]